MLKVRTLFSGIGSPEIALRDLQIPFELIDFCEVDKYAVQSYCAVHCVNPEKNLGDITKVWGRNLHYADLLVWGFPCTDISVAGKQAGIVEGETRSGLYYEGLRILKETKPKYSIIENVKNLTGKKFKAEFEQMLKDIEELGYNNYWEILNAKDYGIPQNRERVFIVSIRKDIDTKTFKFPKGFDNGLRLKDFLEDEVDEKYYIDNAKTKKLLSQLDYSRQELMGIDLTINQPKFKDYANCIKARYDAGVSNQKSDGTGICIPCITPDRIEKRKNGRRFKEDGDPMFTLTSQDRHGILMTEIPQIVKVRKYEVDIKNLKEILRSHKCLSNKEIADKLNKPLTLVEHWFRKDNCFSIPDADIWLKLRSMLNIDTDVFDKSIIEFEEREGKFEKANRIYHQEGIAPTLTSTSADEKIFTQDRHGILTVGQIEGKNFNQNKVVYDVDGLSPTIQGQGHSGNEPKILQVCEQRTDEGLRFFKDGCVGTLRTIDACGDKRVLEQNILTENKPVLVGGIGEKNFGKQYRQGNRVYDSENAAMALNASPVGNAGGYSYLYKTDYRIRKLTPKECWRLMGFKDEDFQRAANAGVSNSQLYKQAGNSIVSNVLLYIFKNLLQAEIAAIYKENKELS